MKFGFRLGPGGAQFVSGAARLSPRAQEIAEEFARGVRTAVPPFPPAYFQSTGDMNDEQRGFYEFFAASIAERRVVDVAGQTSYLYVLASEMSPLFNESPEKAAEAFDWLKTNYPENAKFAAGATFASTNAVLAGGRVEEWYRLTAPKSIPRGETHQADLRVNIAHEHRFSECPLDWLQMYFDQTRPIQAALDDYPRFIDLVNRRWAEWTAQHGRMDDFWVERFRGRQAGHVISSGFMGGHAGVTIRVYPFYRADRFGPDDVLEPYRLIIRAAENDLRRAHGLNPLGPRQSPKPYVAPPPRNLPEATSLAIAPGDAESVWQKLLSCEGREITLSDGLSYRAHVVRPDPNFRGRVLTQAERDRSSSVRLRPTGKGRMIFISRAHISFISDPDPIGDPGPAVRAAIAKLLEGVR